jgi:diguanylate cyclase (GGDEF)-like protein
MLIEDDPGDAEITRAYLMGTHGREPVVKHAQRLSDAMAQMAQQDFDIVLLDLNLPDSRGMTTFAKLHTQFPDVPVIVLSGLADQETALLTVREGAQDFIVKGTYTEEGLLRAIDYAVERNRMRVEMLSTAWEDELTGLSNRRGFQALTAQLIRSANRMNKGVFLVFVDLDGMKQVNDVFGHKQGDQMLKDAAAILTKVFRDSDVVARIGGDEFAVFGIEHNEEMTSVSIARLKKTVREFCAKGDKPYVLSLSVGLARVKPCHNGCMDGLLAAADAKMYEDKRSKNNSRSCSV